MLKRRAGTTVALAVFLGICGVPLSGLALPVAFGAMQAATTAPTRVLGTVTTVGNDSLTIQPANGSAVTVSVSATTRILRLEPGQKSLSEATPIHLTDISTGDRALVSAVAGDNNTLAAHLIVAMKQSDIAARQQAEQQAWQNGVGGIVKSVDAAGNTIVLAATGHDITIQTAPTTSVREYANNSVAFKDSRPSTLAAIHAGDQLRARGTHSADGSSFTANAIVFGDFQNIAGLVLSVDAAANTLTIKDLATHQPVTLAISPTSTLRQLPSRVAEFVAMRLHAMKDAGNASGHNGAMPGNAMPENAGPANSEHNWSHHQQGEGQAAPPAGAGAGFNRVLARATPIQLSDLHKGDAVMVVASIGSNHQPGTALTLLSGVAPMLRASRKASQSLFSSSWSLGGGGGGGQSSGGGSQSSGGSSGDSGGQQGGNAPQRK